MENILSNSWRPYPTPGDGRRTPHSSSSLRLRNQQGSLLLVWSEPTMVREMMTTTALLIPFIDSNYYFPGTVLSALHMATHDSQAEIKLGHSQTQIQNLCVYPPCHHNAELFGFNFTTWQMTPSIPTSLKGWCWRSSEFIFMSLLSKLNPDCWAEDAARAQSLP